jgi:hypothetical protein
MTIASQGPIVVVGHSLTAWLLALWLKAQGQAVAVVTGLPAGAHVPPLHLVAASLADAPTARLQQSALSQWPRWLAVLPKLGQQVALWDVTPVAELTAKLAREAMLDALVGLAAQPVQAGQGGTVNAPPPATPEPLADGATPDPAAPNSDTAEALPPPPVWPFQGQSKGSLLSGKHLASAWQTHPQAVPQVADMVRGAGVFVHEQPVTALTLQGAAVQLGLANRAGIASTRVVWLLDEATPVLQAALGTGLPLRLVQAHTWQCTGLSAEALTRLPATLVRLRQGHVSLTPNDDGTVHCVYDGWADAGQTLAMNRPTPQAQAPLGQALQRTLGTWLPALQSATVAHLAAQAQVLAADFAPLLGRWPGSGLWLGLGLASWQGPLAAGVVPTLGASVLNEQADLPGSWLPNRFVSGFGQTLNMPPSLTPEPTAFVPGKPHLVLEAEPEFAAQVNDVAVPEANYASTVQTVEKTVVKPAQMAVVQERGGKPKVQMAGVSKSVK